ncbi:cop9 signalosome complex subunit [Allomyces javanicus]|nr:cop9 signalosome complex subunit [Allomyces javanicus]
MAPPRSPKRPAPPAEYDLNDLLQAGGDAPAALAFGQAPKRIKSAPAVVEATNVDLDTIMANYQGRNRIDRLIFIGERCPLLAVDAFRLALGLIKAETMDMIKYKKTLFFLNEALTHRGLPNEDTDTDWMDATQRAVRVQTDKLESELKTYKNNSIKESIRMGFNDLGNHYYKCGDMAAASKQYSRARDYCSLAAHHLDVHYNQIRVAIASRDLTPVSNLLTRMEQHLSPDKTPELYTKSHVLWALVHLAQQQHRQAAAKLTNIPITNAAHYADLVAPNDLAIYGGLCALATYDRTDLKRLLDNAVFREHLELEPSVREILRSFYQTKYAQCLALLDQARNDWRLDLYLAPHVEPLLAQVRRRALVQYFAPFKTVDMHAMARAFACPADVLERELVALISAGDLNARIDSQHKVLRAKATDERTRTFQKAVQDGTTFLTNTHHMLLKVHLVQQGLVVQAPGGHGAGGMDPGIDLM